MDLKIGYDIAKKQLIAPDGGALTLPAVTQGDTLRLVLQGMELLDSGDYRKAAIPFGTIKCGIGFIDRSPLDGVWRVSVEAVETPDLPHNIGKQALEVELNKLSTVIARGGVKVVQGGAANIYAIRWINAAETTAFLVTGAKLYPKCFTRVIAWDLDYGRVSIIKLFQAPVAFTDQFSLPMPPAVDRALVRAGTGTRNEVQRISIPVGALGEFSITWNGLTTAILPVSNLTAAKIAAVLNDLIPDGAERFRVTQPSARYYYVEFVGPLALAAQALMEVNMENQPVLETPVGKIPLTGPGVEVALDGNPEVAMSIEIEVILDGESGTPVQAPITLLNDMIDDPMAISNDPAWLEQQIDPVAWLEHDHSQVFHGERHYVAIVGDGVLGQFVYEHNLGTTRLHVTLWENGGTNLRIPDNLYETKALDDNRVQVTFPDAPDENAYLVLITSIGPESYFLGHEHAISEIIGLQAILDALTAAGNPADFWPNIPVEKLPLNIPWDRIGGGTAIPASRLPSTVPLLNTEGKLDITTIPLGVPRVDSATGELVYWGIDQATGDPIRRVLADATGRIVFDAIPNRDTPEQIKIVVPDLAMEYPPLKTSATRAATYRALLRAVKPSALADIETLIEGGSLPDPSTHENVVLQWSGSVQSVTVPGSATRRGGLLTRATAPFVACDGANWFAAEVFDGTYYPYEFNREVFDIPVQADMLSVGTYFEIQWTLLAQLLGPRRGQYVMTLKLGTPAATGSGMGTNLASVTFGTTLFEKQLLLSEAETQHAFAYRVRRPASETFTAEQRLYLAWADATAPTTAAFVLRGELNRFDAEDPTAALGFSSFTGNNGAPVGQVKISCKGIKATISKL